jgi:hypothetical protein
MANDLNIETNNFGNNVNYMFLHDPALFLDFHDGNGLLGIGYLEAEKIWRQKVTYAVFKSGIPKTEIARDIIDQEFTLEATLKQLQAETIALVSQRRYDDSDDNWNRVIFGHEAPPAVYPSAVLIGKNKNGREMRLWIRRLQITAEDLELTFGGDNYASVPFNGMAQKDEDPQTTNPDWPYNPTYGDQDSIAFFSWPKTGYTPNT